MTLSRRRLLLLATGLPMGLVLAPFATTYGRALRDVAAQVRPAPEGTSGTRCAVCGAVDHAMLAATCPSRPLLRGTGVR